MPLDAVSEPASPDSARTSAEVAAATALHERATSVRRTVIVASTLFGIVLGVGAYFALREVFFETFGAHMPFVTGAVAFAPPFAASIRLGKRLADSIVRSRMGSWMTALALSYHVRREVLEEHARLAVG